MTVAEPVCVALFSFMQGVRMQRSSGYASQFGFTMIELLVVIAIMGTFVYVSVLTIGLQSNPVSIAKLRANSDGYDDVAILRSANSGSLLEVRAISGLPGNPVLQTLAAPASPRKVISVDLNGDGADDIVSLHGTASSGTLGIFRNNGLGSFNSSSINAGISNPTDIAAADLNSDGKPDLFVGSGNSANGFTYSIIYSINGTNFNTPLVAHLSQAQGLVDLGLMAKDLPAISQDERDDFEQQVQVGPVAEGEAESLESPLSFTGVRAVAIANVTGDNRPDLILAIADFGGSSLQIMENTSGGFVAADELVLNQAGNPTALAAADFNRDGLIDIAVSDADANSVSMFMNLPGPGFGTELSFATAESPVALHVANLDSDLYPDLIASTEAGTLSNGSATITLLMNNGQGGFFASNVNVGVQNVRTVVSGNFSPSGNQTDLLLMHAWNPSLAVYALWQ